MYLHTISFFYNLHLDMPVLFVYFKESTFKKTLRNNTTHTDSDTQTQYSVRLKEQK